jgi:TRAP-type C4-dicarboxylate transport system substrate-binding protein
VRIILRYFFPAFLCLSSAGAEALAAGNGTYNLILAGGYAREHRLVREVFLPWAARIGERTGGKVNITYFPPNVLGPEREHFELVLKGRVDIGHNFFARNPGSFPVSSVADIPGPSQNPAEASLALWRMVQSVPETKEEYAGVKLLALHVSAPGRFCWTAAEAPTAPVQLKGKKLLVDNGETARMIRSLGGNPLVIPKADFQLYLSRGLAEGCVLPLDELRALKVIGTLKSITLEPQNTRGWWLAMSLRTWNGLPPEYREIIEEESGEKLSFLSGSAIMAEERSEAALLEAEGLRIARPGAAEKAEWLELTAASFRAGWFRRMAERKLQSRRILDESMEIRRETAFPGVPD